MRSYEVAVPHGAAIRPARTSLWQSSPRASPAVWFLGKQEMTQQDAAHFTLHAIVKGSGDPAV